MTTKEQIAVMQAYVEGKQIEGKAKTCEKWFHIIEPRWNWTDMDYRVKCEPKYRPYKDTAEMIADWKERFGTYDTKVVMPPIWVKDGKDGKFFVTDYYYNLVGLFSINKNLIDLFYGFTYLDGSPCGKEES